MRSTALQNNTVTAINREIGSQYDNVKIVADNIDYVIDVANGLASIKVVQSALPIITRLHQSIVQLDRLHQSITQLDRLHVSIASIDRIYSSISKLDRLYTSINNLDRINTSITKLDTIFNSISNLDRLYTSITKLDSLYLNITKLDTLYTNLTMLNSMFSNLSVYTGIYNNLAILGNVNTNMATIQAVNRSLTSTTGILYNIQTTLGSILAAETNAKASEIASKASETASKASEIASKASAGQASVYMGRAKTAETRTAADLVAVQKIFNNFDKEYLGSSATAPTKDHKGNALIQGAIYWDTTRSDLMFYDGTQWLLPSTLATSGATAAQASAAASATSATSAQSILDDFETKYLGPKGTAPTKDNKGNTLLQGALYYDTANKELYYYDGTKWSDVKNKVYIDTQDTTNLKTAKDYTDQKIKSLVIPTPTGFVDKTTVGEEISVLKNFKKGLTTGLNVVSLMGALATYNGIGLNANNTGIWSTNTDGRINFQQKGITHYSLNPTGIPTNTTDLVSKAVINDLGIKPNLRLSSYAYGDSNTLQYNQGVDNIGIGTRALEDNISGGNNIGIGTLALGSNTAGMSNIGIGYEALSSNIIGSSNIGIGFGALSSNTTADDNFAIGNSALRRNTTGHSNVAVGSLALYANITGEHNIAFGNNALKNNLSDNNIAFGYYALAYNTTGNRNVAFGNRAGGATTTGDCNTAFGNKVLSNNSLGNSNTVFGYSAGATITTGDNNICIGSEVDSQTGNSRTLKSIATSSNIIVMGNTDHTNAYIKIGWNIVSDKRDKLDINSLELGLNFVKQLNPISYKFRKDRDKGKNIPHGQKRYGFLAQEVLALEGKDNVIINNQDPDHLSITTDYLVPVLVKAIQEQDKKIDDLEKRLLALESKISG